MARVCVCVCVRERERERERDAETHLRVSIRNGGPPLVSAAPGVASVRGCATY